MGFKQKWRKIKIYSTFWGSLQCIYKSLCKWVADAVDEKRISGEDWFLFHYAEERLGTRIAAKCIKNSKILNGMKKRTNV